MTIDPLILDVLRLRTAATRITAGKLTRALDTVEPDGRLRDMHVYHGAGTGRFSGRGVQVQNLPRGVGTTDSGSLLPWAVLAGPLTLERIGAAARAVGTTADAVISTLIRPCLTAAPGNVLAICDYAAIECRGVAWVAGEEKLLDAYRTGADIYRELAARLFNVPQADVTDDQRWVGKQIILGCGYGMSARKFDLMCANFGVKLSDVGVTAEQCVELYRDTYSKIAGEVAGVYDGRPYRRGGVWHKFGIALLQVVGREATGANVGRCRLHMDDGSLVLTLPSGRAIVYRSARVAMLAARVAGVPVGERRPTVVYDSPRHGPETVLFGAKAVENAVQAIARDLMCDALVRCEAEGLRPVLHAHDEIVCEVPAANAAEALDKLAAIMTSPPKWADGFPVGVEGHCAPRYTKGKWPGYGSVKR